MGDEDVWVSLFRMLEAGSFSILSGIAAVYFFDMLLAQLVLVLDNGCFTDPSFFLSFADITGRLTVDRREDLLPRNNKKASLKH